MARGPFRFGEVIGQRRIVRMLRRLLENARHRDGTIGFVGLFGPSGAGKTSLVQRLAEELGIPCYVFVATEKTKLEELKAFFSALQHFDIGFIDEAHNLSPAAQELFFQIHDRGAYDEMPPREELSAGAPARPRSVNVAAFNAIFGTDQPGGFQKAFERRLDGCWLDPYSQEEIKAILLKRAVKVPLTSQAARLLAQVCKDSPGHGVKLLNKLQLWIELGKLQIGEADVREFLVECGIDEQSGLNNVDQQYLRLINGMPKGRATLQHIAVHLRCDVPFVSRWVEPYLFQQGFIEITSVGRVLTNKAVLFLEGKNANESQSGSAIEGCLEASVSSESASDAEGASRGGEEPDFSPSGSRAEDRSEGLRPEPDGARGPGGDASNH
jgi:Holliday junction DNA helicase RuvB